MSHMIAQFAVSGRMVDNASLCDLFANTHRQQKTCKPASSFADNYSAPEHNTHSSHQGVAPRRPFETARNAFPV